MKKKPAKKVTKKAAPRRKAPAAKKRARVSNVRPAIVSILAAGDSTRAELLQAIGCSVASLDGHLKALREAHQVTTSGKHPIRFSLRSPDAAVIGEPPIAPSTSTALVPAVIPPDLQLALHTVRLRLGRRERVAEKIGTLEQLAEAMPPEIAAVLTEIRDDYLSNRV